MAGDGQVLKLSPTGEVELKKEAPHAAALNEHPEELRAEVIAQAKQRAEQLGRQTKMYDQMIDRTDKQIASIKEQIAAAENSAEQASEGDAPSNEKNPAAPGRGLRGKPAPEQHLALLEKRKEMYVKAKAQWEKMAESRQTGELTEEQIDALVKSSLAYKKKASSICATGDDVFLAAHAAAGYGFEIWRMDERFENAAVIVKELRGCCGQMDVKANGDGVFVAENARHRVGRFDRDGKEIGAWGFGARTGLEGFGSCCNPMNVAFGPQNAIYTSEDDTGRIKRYSPEGKLLGLVGAVELKPGCKNVSIAVSNDGSRVYMLDITRNHLVQLNARPADDVAADIEAAKNAPRRRNRRTPPRQSPQVPQVQPHRASSSEVCGHWRRPKRLPRRLPSRRPSRPPRSSMPRHTVGFQITSIGSIRLRVGCIVLTQSGDTCESFVRSRPV